jgi:type I restriction enzyme, S subunit
VRHEWTSRALGEVATLQRGFDLPHRLRKPGIIPIVTSSGFGETHSEAKVIGPGVVTGRYGTIGEVFFISENFWPLNTTLYIRDFHGNDPLFISYVLRTIDFHSHSGKSGVPGVNRNDLHELVVNFPPSLLEQEAIAQALSDADALIESLEQLIAKKRQVKQGAMQELLRIREDWKEVALGSICNFTNGKPYEDLVVVSGEFSLITLDSISIEGKLKTQHRSIDTSDNSLVKGDLVIVLSDIAHAKLLGLCDLIPLNNKFVLNQRMGRLRFDPNYDPGFFRYQINKNQEYFRMRGQGSSQKHIYKRDIYELVVAFPSQTKQIEIRSTLDDMDAEIVTLETKLEKARQVKQGMMHNLLTGRIRLV